MNRIDVSAIGQALVPRHEGFTEAETLTQDEASKWANDFPSLNLLRRTVKDKVGILFSSQRQ